MGGGSGLLKALAINPGGLKWSSLGQLGAHFSQNATRYLYQFLFWLVLFGVSTAIMGVPSGLFIPAFIVLYLLSVVMFAIAGWADAAKFNLEAPLVALVLGLVVANVFRLPKWSCLSLPARRDSIRASPAPGSAPRSSPTQPVSQQRAPTATWRAMKTRQSRLSC